MKRLTFQTLGATALALAMGVPTAQAQTSSPAPGAPTGDAAQTPHLTDKQIETEVGKIFASGDVVLVAKIQKVGHRRLFGLLPAKTKYDLFFNASKYHGHAFPEVTQGDTLTVRVETNKRKAFLQMYNSARDSKHAYGPEPDGYNPMDYFNYGPENARKVFSAYNSTLAEVKSNGLTPPPYTLPTVSESVSSKTYKLDAVDFNAINQIAKQNLTLSGLSLEQARQRLEAQRKKLGADGDRHQF